MLGWYVCSFTYELEPTGWANITQGLHQTPPAREFAGISSDYESFGALMFGGDITRSGSPPELGDTWVFG